MLITGHLSRNFAWYAAAPVDAVRTIVVPYLLFEFAAGSFRSRVRLRGIGAPLWLNPHWPMWYLAGVFLWRMATPMLKRHRAALPISIAVSLLFAGLRGT